MRAIRSVIVFVPLLLSILVSGIAVASHEDFATAEAHQRPVNQSGAQGVINFTDTDAGVIVTGAATGLQPSFGRYVTLVYDIGSVPGGPTVCEPTVEMEGMFVGIWVVDADGNGTLLQLGVVAPLGSFDTVSIRDTEINQGFGPEAVVACGQVALHPAAP